MTTPLWMVIVFIAACVIVTWCVVMMFCRGVAKNAGGEE